MSLNYTQANMYFTQANMQFTHANMYFNNFFALGNIYLTTIFLFKEK